MDKLEQAHEGTGSLCTRNVKRTIKTYMALLLIELVESSAIAILDVLID